MSKKVANFLWKKSTIYEELNTKYDELNRKHQFLRIAFGTLLGQYLKFGVIAKQTFLEANNALEMDSEFKKILDNNQLPISAIDTVPRADYEALRISYDRHIGLVGLLQEEIQQLKNPKEPV
jgi:hypothetical protein